MNQVLAKSPAARADAVIARLHTLYPRLIDLSLGRLERLLAGLGHPERHLPPVIHVAGTNGKGSTAAFLRAIAEAAGNRVHVYTSPHLVRFNERIRIAGELVSDALLAETLEELERANADEPITVFEMTTAAAFVLFARHPADLCVLEVGLGGRFDATNVIPPPAACAITSISFDHQEFLGHTLAAIAGEKAGIIKPGVPVATGEQAPEAFAVIAAEAERLHAPLLARGGFPFGLPNGNPGIAWNVSSSSGSLRYQSDSLSLDLPAPALPGPYQFDNAGIAITALAAAGFASPEGTIARGLRSVTWPARLQRLTGRLAHRLPTGFSLWLDGGHNPGAGQALARHLATWRDQPLHLIVGMKIGKDSSGFLAPLMPYAASLFAVAEAGQHQAASTADIIAASQGRALPGPTVASALAAIGQKGPPGRVLIAGSLYLAGVVLAQDEA